MFSKESTRREQFLIVDDVLQHTRRERLRKIENSKIVHLVDRFIAALLISGKSLTSLNDTKQAIRDIYKIQHAMGLLPELIEKPNKSNQEAYRLRLEGNKKFAANDDMEALRLYTRAICCAESEGEEMSMAYANRSAVTLRLKEYENSIKDATIALSTDKYPKRLIPKLLERRGKCFIAQGQYKKASEDFKQVVRLTLDLEINTVTAKLIKTHVDLLVECEGKKDIPAKSPQPSPKLTHEPSTHIQCASAAVDVAFSPEMGRHIVATIDIAPGDILAIEKPYVSALEPDCWEYFCEYCNRRCHSSIPCESCNVVVFCSKVCRETCWTTYHAVECDVLHNLMNLGCEGASCLAVKTLLKVTKLGKNLAEFAHHQLNDSESNGSYSPERRGFVNNIYMSDHYQSIHHLTTNADHLYHPELNVVATIASSLVHILKETTTFFKPSDSEKSGDASTFDWDLQWNHVLAVELLMRYIMLTSSGNSYETEEILLKRNGDELYSYNHPIGCAIYPFIFGLRNHSCEPNTCSYHYKGNTVVMFATKPITKGQQIFGHYDVWYGVHDRFSRQHRLESKFFFTCKCTACLEHWPTYPNMPDVLTFISSSTKNRFRREFYKKMKILQDVMSTIRKGKATEEDFKTLIHIFTMIHINVKQPWKVYLQCQEAIAFYVRLSFNPIPLEDTPTSKEDRPLA